MKSLVVKRKVLNAEEILKFADCFDTCLELDDIHVTVMFSPTAFEWDHIVPQSDILEIDAICTFKKFGNANVCTFNDERLQTRHCQLVQLGARPTFSPYQPHVTVTYDEDNLPNTGHIKIKLGAEEFAETNPNWKDKVKIISNPFSLSVNIGNEHVNDA